MKLSFVVAFALLCALVPSPIFAQGCELTSWLSSTPPHTMRTDELPATGLRDTVVSLYGTPRKISIPPGFTMTVFAQVSQCRGLAFSPDGVLYATSYTGRIYALPDHHASGKPDSTIVVASGLGRAHGIGFCQGKLYISTDSGALLQLNSSSLSRTSVRLDTIAHIPALGGHFSRNFVIDSAKKKLYVQIGSAGNMDTSDLAKRAQVWEMNFDGSQRRTFARGLRNAVGMDLDPRTGALWVNNNGMDNLFYGITSDRHADSMRTDNNPSECVYILCDGANYGWPWCYGYQMRNPQSPWVNLDTTIVKTFSGPVAEVLAHEAPLGLHFYRGSAFPPVYHHAIFQCYHGSWNRIPAAPPRITVMWADTDGRNAHLTDFVNGFQPDSADNRWGRVVSVVESPAGDLYVSDDQAGVIYKIAYTGGASGLKTPGASAISNLRATPNPARDEVTIEFSLDKPESVHAEVYDLLGRCVLRSGVSEGNLGMNSLRLAVGALPDASYFVCSKIGETTNWSRLIVSH